MREEVELLKRRYETLISYSILISRLPIDEWLSELENAEEVAIAHDPTLFKAYVKSAKPEVLKKIMVAALELKRTVECLEPEFYRILEQEIKDATG